MIVTDDDNFPTDRYVLEGLAAQRGLELRVVHGDIDEGLDLDALRNAIDETTALVSLSHVAYRSGALLDMATVNDLAHTRARSSCGICVIPPALYRSSWTRPAPTSRSGARTST